MQPLPGPHAEYPSRKSSREKLRSLPFFHRTWICGTQLLAQAQFTPIQGEIRLVFRSGTPLPVNLALECLTWRRLVRSGNGRHRLDRPEAPGGHQLVVYFRKKRLAPWRKKSPGKHSARKRSLRESEERFRTLAVSTPMVVWTNLPNGQVDYISQRWYDLTGQTPEQVCQSPNGWMSALHPEDREHAEATLLALRPGGRALRNGDALPTGLGWSVPLASQPGRATAGLPVERW